MRDLAGFRQAVEQYCKRVGRTQKDLAATLNIAEGDLNKRLHDYSHQPSRRTWRLQPWHVKAIVETLARWGAITARKQAFGLFTLIDFLTLAEEIDWQATPWNKLHVDASPMESPAPHTMSVRRPKTFDEISSHTRAATNELNSDGTPAHVLMKQQPENKPIVEGEAVSRKIEKLIDALSNFHSNPEGIYYIGQTLVECSAFLEECCINDEAVGLINDLIEEIDTDERHKEGLLDPVISVGKVRKLIHRLREIRKRLIQSRIV